MAPYWPINYAASSSTRGFVVRCKLSPSSRTVSHLVFEINHVLGNGVYSLRVPNDEVRVFACFDGTLHGSDRTVFSPCSAPCCVTTASTSTITAFPSSVSVNCFAISGLREFSLTIHFIFRAHAFMQMRVVWVRMPKLDATRNVEIRSRHRHVYPT